MSVIKASSNDKVPHVVIEGKAMSSTYNTTEFSHQNITKKMAKLVSDKNMMKLFNHKSQNQQKDISIFLPVALSSMQQILQFSDLAKELITWKESAYIGEGNQTAEQNKELNIKETEPLINHYLFTEHNNLDINPLPHLTTMDQAENVGALIVDNNANIKLQSNSLTEDQVEISYNLVADNNFDTNLITSTPTVDNNLPMTPNISAEQNITDEDETPLYNTMMVGFPLQNIPQRAKGKVSDNSVQYEKNKFQLSEKTQLNVESSLAELASKNTLRLTLKQLKPQIKTEQPHIEHAEKTVIKSVNPQEIGQELLKPIHHRPISSSDTTS